MRILGLDLGSVTLGIAVSDVMGMIARPVETLRFNPDDYDQAIILVQPYIKEFAIDTIVLGLPRHMNGDIGIRGNISLDFKEKLEAAGDVNVILWDERLTTAAAKRILISGDVSRKKRKKIIDQMAAVQILQSYLDSKY